MIELKNYLVDELTTVRECMEILNLSRRILFSVNSKQELKGCVTDGDIRRWILDGKSLDAKICDGAMNTSPYFVYEGETRKARKLIDKFDLFAVPVLSNEQRVVNVIFWNKEIDSPQTEVIDTPVVIMAGGKGERLMPYTSIVPKPLIPIGEKPISELVIESFSKHGCKDFYFTLNYRKNMIKAYFDDLEKSYNVRYVEEKEPLGTGGSLFYLKDTIEETFFVSNCDILLDIDYVDVLKFHREKGNLITVITSLKKYVIPYGTVKLSEDGQIEEMIEKPSNDYLVNTGVYVMEPEVFNYLGEKKFIHITDIIESCINEGKKIGTYPVSENSWMDMGEFDELDKMKKRVNR